MEKEIKKTVIIKCMNEKCNNYKQVLNEGTEICSLCGEETTKIETNENPKLAMRAIIMGLASFGIFVGGGMFLFYMMFGEIVGTIAQILFLLAIPASFVLAIRSKSKKAIVITLICFLIAAGLFVYNMLYWYI